MAREDNVRNNRELPLGCRMADDLTSTLQMTVTRMNLIIEENEDPLIKEEASKVLADSKAHAEQLVRLRGCRTNFTIVSGYVVTQCLASDCPLNRLADT